MKYLWDTDTCIYHLNGNAQIAAKIKSRLNEPITTLFAQNKAMLKKQGLLIGDFDVLIASFAIHHKLILVTNNTEHFERIPATRLENWSA